MKEVKDELVGGLFVAVFFASVIVLAFFMWAPAAHFLSRWNNYWDPQYTNAIQTPAGYLDRYTKASADCKVRAAKYFGTATLSEGYASSTSGDGWDAENDYKTYTCKGYLLTSI